MFLTKAFASKPMTVCGVLFILVAAIRLANADALKEARVSQVIQDVRLLEAHGAPHAAAVNDKVIFGSAVRTGVESRAELTFNDLTITRLGANTIFSFTAGARQAELTQGAILLQVPPNAPPVKANTTAVTVAVMGGTALLSTGPPSKFMVLEGNGEIYPIGHPEKAVTIHAGEMVLAEGGHVNKPEKFDVKLVLATSPLVTDFAPLANLPLILTVVNQQTAEQQVVVSNPPPYKSTIDTIDVTSQSTTANPVVVEAVTSTPTPAPPPPTPSTFGTPSTITSPNPYLITSGTVITTDPSITTNGVTDFGKIYRGSGDDGDFSLWAFGSTSAFDTALSLNNEFFADPDHLPIAVFKFQNLSLVGNPTIDLSNGGVTKLALIGVDGITSGPPGGTLTFIGLDFLALATVNGSINLTSDVSFQNLSELAMYARGAGSDLILNSPISNVSILELAAQGSIDLTSPSTMSVGEFTATAGNNLTLQLGGSLLLDGKVNLNTLVLPGTTVITGANLTLNATGDYTNSSATEFSQLQVTNQGHIETGGNIAVNIGDNLTATGPGSATQFPEPGDFEAVVQNTNGQIDNGGNLNLTVNGNVQVNGLAAYVQNYDETVNPAGHIGTGGNIDIEIGENLTANSYVDVFLNNRGGGMIDSGGNLTFNVGGALNIGADAGGTSVPGFSAEFIISNRYDDSMGNTTPSFIGSDVSLFLHAASIDMAGILFGSGISNADGSVIDGNATVTWDVPGNVMIQGTTGIPNSLNGASWFINNHATSLDQFTPPSGGTIHGNATLTLSIGGDLTIAGDTSIEILNQRAALSPAPSGGTIDSDATLNISAANFSVGGELDIDIRNRNNGIGSGTGGSIGGNTAINLTLSGDLAVTGNDPNSGGVPGDANIYIANENDVGGSGGFIGGDATVNVNVAGGLQVGDVATFQIFNQSNVVGSPGGTIGGSASINITAASIGIAGDAIFQILNNDGGQIGGDANLFVTTQSDGNFTANSIDAEIINRNGGTIGSSADVNFGIGGTLTTSGDSTFAITNRNDGSGGGVINGDVTIELTAANVSIGGGLLTDISTNRGGHIASAFNNVSVGSALTAQSYLDFEIENAGFDNGSGFAPGGTIGADAILDVIAGNMSTGTDYFNAGIFNDGGGHIGGSAIMTVVASGAINAGTDAFFTITNNQSTEGQPAGTIGGDAAINITAAGISTGGGLFPTIDNSGGGSIGGNASLAFSLTGDLTSQGDAIFTIDNSNAGTIGGNATIDVTATNITANSLTAQIDNTGGSIGASNEGGATINMNVSNSATVTTDATVAIYGSDGAGGATININGGNYNAGGTFLSYIDGNGTITFTNATAHADVLKAGVLGANGVLNIGGGMLSADTELKLYASGSNGMLNFLSNVTLGGNALTKILAANTINILDNVVVTIAGSTPVDVYTNNANYAGFGGNGTTTGTFAGAGANNPQPLANAPPFGSSASPRPNGRLGNHGAENRGMINVSNSAELLALLDGAAVGPDGRITFSGSRNANNLRNLSRSTMNGLPRGARQMLIQQTRDRDAGRVGGKRIL